MSYMFPGCDRESGLFSRSIVDDAKRLSDDFNSEESRVYAAKRLSKFFEIDFTIKLYGHLIFHYSHSPSKNISL